MARRCVVCDDQRIEAINIRCLEGLGTQAICEEFGLSRSSVNQHRISGHAARKLTEMVIQGSTSPLSDLHQIFIAQKAFRVRRLDELLGLAWNSLKTQELGGADKVDPVLIKVSQGLLECAAKEMGEWKPDGGAKADATMQLAQSIVIHAAVSAKLSIDSDKSRQLETEDIPMLPSGDSKG